MYDFDLNDALNSKNMHEFHDKLTAKIFNYENADQYFKKSLID